MDEEQAIAMGYVGALIAVARPDGQAVCSTYGLTPEYTAADLHDYAAERYARLSEHGPSMDGWRVDKLPDGSFQFQLMIRAVTLSDMDFLADADAMPDIGSEQSSPDTLG